MTQNIPAINMIATGQKIIDLRVAAWNCYADT